MSRPKPEKKPIILDFDIVGDMVTKIAMPTGNGAHVSVDKEWIGERVIVILPKRGEKYGYRLGK